MDLFKFICIKFFGRMAPQPVSCWSLTVLALVQTSGAVRLGFMVDSGPHSSPDEFGFPLSVGCHPTDSTNHDTCDMTLSLF